MAAADAAAAGVAAEGTVGTGVVDAALEAGSRLVRRVMLTATGRHGADPGVDTSYPEGKAAVAVA